VDLGGLYHVTEKQLGLHEAFLERGVLAVLGAGAGPGKTNVMAAHAAAQLDQVDTIRGSSAGYDESPPDGLAPPYALATLLDELTEPPMVFRDGRPAAIAPLTDGGEIDFPAPVGRRGSINTLHSEVLTLPESLGARACDFRLSLAPGVHTALLRLLDLPAEERGRVPTEPPSARTWSAQHVEVTGTREGRDVAVTVTSLTPPHEGWGMGGGIVSTASVAAATARLYARGLLHAAGTLPPERILSPELLFGELARRGTTFQTTTTEVARA
jgi:saccharopine dehydrogenase-like NADP-dependent oxidoreductase